MPDRNREFLECHDADVTLYLHVQPRASRTAWSGVQAGRMKLRLAAPPVDDRANRECVAFVAKTHINFEIEILGKDILSGKVDELVNFENVHPLNILIQPFFILYRKKIILLEFNLNFGFKYWKIEK